MKPNELDEKGIGDYVVPYIGTWVETITIIVVKLSKSVVPYIGTWVETLYENDLICIAGSYLI